MQESRLYTPSFAACLSSEKGMGMKVFLDVELPFSEISSLTSDVLGSSKAEPFSYFCE